MDGSKLPCLSEGEGSPSTELYDGAICEGGPERIAEPWLDRGNRLQVDNLHSIASGQSAASVSITVTIVPEPGVVAFGVLAAGSVLGLIARKRKA